MLGEMPSSSMPTLDRDSRVPIYKQIERFFVEEIRSGRLLPQTAVCGAVELAERLGISHLTVRQSYKRLTEQGLIYSIRGKGTFIAEQKGQKGQKVLAVAVGAEFLRSSSSSGVYTAITQALHKMAIEGGWALKMLVCTTPYAQQVQGELDAHDLAQFEDTPMAGLFVCGMLLPAGVIKRLRRRGVQMVATPSDSEGVEHTVVVDQQRFLLLPAQYARSRGVDRPAVIYLDLEDHFDRKQRIIAAFAEHGYDLNPAHAVGVSVTSVTGGQIAAEHLLRTYPQMDGLICYDDLLSQGMCAACVKHHRSVPDDLLVIAHANKDVTPPFLVPTARMSVDVARMSRMAFEKMRCLIAGKECGHIPSTLEPALIPEQTAAYLGEEIELNVV